MVLCRTLRDFGFGRDSIEYRIHEEATDLIERLEQNCGKPMDLPQQLHIPLVSSLWTMIQGERVDPHDPFIVEMIREWQRAFYEFGQNIIQVGLTSAPLMKILHALDMVHFDQVFGRFFQFLGPAIDQHKASLAKEGEHARDLIDRYLLEVMVCHFCHTMLLIQT